MRPLRGRLPDDGRESRPAVTLMQEVNMSWNQARENWYMTSIPAKSAMTKYRTAPLVATCRRNMKWNIQVVIFVRMCLDFFHTSWDKILSFYLANRGKVCHFIWQLGEVNFYNCISKWKIMWHSEYQIFFQNVCWELPYEPQVCPKHSNKFITIVKFEHLYMWHDQGELVGCR